MERLAVSWVKALAVNSFQNPSCGEERPVYVVPPIFLKTSLEIRGSISEKMQYGSYLKSFGAVMACATLLQPNSWRF